MIEATWHLVSSANRLASPVPARPALGAEVKPDTAGVFPFGSEMVWQQAAEVLTATAVICLMLSLIWLLMALIASDIWPSRVPGDKAIKEKDKLKVAQVLDFIESSASYSTREHSPPLADQLAMFIAGDRRVWRRARLLTVPSALIALLGAICIILFMIIELMALPGRVETAGGWQYVVGFTVIFGIAAGFSSLFVIVFLAALKLQQAQVGQRAEWCAVTCWVEAIEHFKAMRSGSPLALIDRRQNLANSIEQAARYTQDIYQKRLAPQLSGDQRIELNESGVARAKGIKDMAMRSLISEKFTGDNSDPLEMLVSELLQLMYGRFEILEPSAPTGPEVHQPASRWRLVLTGFVLTAAGLAYPHTPLGRSDAGSYAETIFVVVGVISLLFGTLGARTATALLSALKGVVGGGDDKA